MTVQEAVITTLLADNNLADLVGGRINVNQSEQEDYAFPFVVLSFSGSGSKCRDGQDEEGVMIAEIYTETYKEMQLVLGHLQRLLNNKQIGGYWFEDLEGDFDKVSNDVNGITMKEITIMYYN